jgi:Carboxypeptidase regulatory-like domain
MKRHSFIIAAAVLVLAGAALWRLTRPIAAPSVALTSPSPATMATAATQVSPNRYEPPIKGEYRGESDPRWEWWRAMEKQDPKFEWEMPINFYGKVVDQDNKPIAGAAVKFVWNDMSSKGSSSAEGTSDANGLFSLADKRGKGLSVSVSKNGYHVGTAATGSFEYVAFFEWNYHVPNENDPTIFRLIRKVDAEPLIVASAFNTLSYEQAIYYYDLQQGRLARQKTPVGDGLRFTLTRSQAAQGQPFDWTWTIDGVSLMVQATTDEFPQTAPLDGYVSSWKIQQRAGARNFHREAKVRLYVRTSGARYGVVDLHLSHPHKQEIGPTLSVKSYVNPSGSRNLEYDPRKVAGTGK